VSVADAVGATPKETDAMTTDEKPTLGDLLEQRNGMAYALASEYVTEKWQGDEANAPEYVREFLRLDAEVEARVAAVLVEMGLVRG
jgi:hypothetical protein